MYVTKDEIKRGTVAGFAFTLLMLAFGADGFLPAPKPSSLVVFTGQVEEVQFLENARSWKIALASSDDRRVFHVPADLCLSLERDINIGETATAKLHRRVPLGKIRAWELKASGKEILSYEDSVKQQRPPRKMAGLILIMFLGFSLGMTFMQIAHRPKRNA
ncbi:hypothetical protein [Gilvimarinus algae]|uniref:Uncharacterized protein n=1 Tax=Gilvimarinus algae TaxID=3058037 RepID=A0ABT8TDS4_9GAMM|nr:hypothetical protein [Gilvimarinus sp. SDUM040014]MDO3380816.1 hypothetical protein [Gilvimarinus sp. SDUM040014]